MDDQKRNTVKQIVKLKIDLIRFSIMQQANQIDNVSVEFAVNIFIDGLIAAQFSQYDKNEILNAIVNGWVFEFKEMLVEEIMADEEIKLMHDMELKLV